MRLRLIMKDKEYGKAFAEVISQTAKNVVVEINGDDFKTDNNTIILTDIDTCELNIKDIRNVVEMSDNPHYRNMISDEAGHNRLFKYNNVSNILAELDELNFSLNGFEYQNFGFVSRVFAVCEGIADCAATVSNALARQIAFRKSNNIAVVSFEYINRFPCPYEDSNSRFARWMYYMDIGRKYSIDVFTYTDSYGISYIRLPAGLNPVAYMSNDEIKRIIKELCSKGYETIIVDIGNCYSPANIEFMKTADNVLYISEAENTLNTVNAVKEYIDSEKLTIIDSGKKISDIEIVLDEYVREVYQLKEDRYEQEGNNKKILQTNR